MSERIASMPIRAMRRVEIIVKRSENRDLRSETHYKLFNLPAIASPAILQVAREEVKLKPPVRPSTSSTSPAKYNQGQSLDSIVLGFTSSVLTPQAVTNSSPARLWIRWRGNPSESKRDIFLRASLLSI
jgi:hypothetical protein